MSEVFQFEYTGAAFELFGSAHLATVGLLAVFSILYLRQGRAASDDLRARMRIALGLAIIALDVVSHAWYAANGAWSVQEMLPLHMCGVMTWVMCLSFVFDWRRTYVLIYFLGLGGAIQAIITPDPGIYGFPHFRFFDSLISHWGLVLGGLWVVVVEAYRPTLRSLLGTFLGLNAYALLIYFVNSALGSNYLYVNGKPEVATAMDFMPDWPFYILVLEGLALTLFTLMYLPFRWVSWRRLATVPDVSA